MLLSLFITFPTKAASPAVDIVSSSSDAVIAAANDIKTIPYEDQVHCRYFWVVYPTDLFRRSFKLHINLLSRTSVPIDIVEVKPFLWRIDLRDPKWNPLVWEKATEQDPWFHVKGTLKTRPLVYLKVKMADGSSFELKLPDAKSTYRTEIVSFRKYRPVSKAFKRGRSYLETKKHNQQVTLGGPLLPVDALNDLRKYCSSEAPILMAEWFFVQSARQRNLQNEDDHGLGYYDFLELKDRNAYFKLIQFNYKESELFGREFMAALDHSRISPQNRQFFVGRSLGGNVWGTLDTDKQRARSVALRNLRRRGKGSFEHNTEEWYAPLPNGLFATFLSDDKGVRQNVAPGDTHGLHDTSPANESVSAVLHINLGCINCHAADVLKPFRDDVRDQFKAGNYLLLGAYKKKDFIEFERLYLSDIYDQMATSRNEYVKAVYRSTKISKNPRDVGLSPAVAFKAYSRQFYKYGNDRVTIKTSARMLGISEEVWRAALVRYTRPFGSPVLSDVPLTWFLSKTPFTMSILTFEDSIPLAYQVVAQELTARSLLAPKKVK